MKLTFVSNDLTIGGAQRLFIDIANKLAERGHEVVFISLSVVPNRLSLTDTIDSSISVVQLDFTSAYSLSGWLRLIQALRVQKGGIVFSTLFLANFAARITIPFHGRPVVVVEQNTYDEKKHIFMFLDWLLSFLTKKIVCTSESVLTFTAKQERIKRERFMVIHSGVDIPRLHAMVTPADRAGIRAEFSIPDNARVFLDVARLTGQKGHSLLLDSFSALLSEKQRDEYYLVLVGEGGLRAELEAHVVRLGITDRVIFTGARHDVARFYVAADYFISTSRIEGFSLVHAEALSFGLPIVTTRTAGPDVMILEGENGYFVEPHVQAVVEGCNRLLQADYQRFSENARRRAEAFSIECTVERYEALAQSFL